MGHHYVPQFLLRQWTVRDNRERLLHGYYWDDRAGKMKVNRRGTKAFCQLPGLFSVKGLEGGDDAIEAIFFAGVDNQASYIHQQLIDPATEMVTMAQRNGFIELILSLETRRPDFVAYVKQTSVDIVNAGFQEHASLRQMLDRDGTLITPDELTKEHTGFYIADWAMEVLQDLSQNQTGGDRLLRARWMRLRVPEGCERAILGDRPLIWTEIKDDPGNMVWHLPLSPDCILICCEDEATMTSIASNPPADYVRSVNREMVAQCDRYVFCTHQPTDNWLEDALRQRALDWANFAAN